MIQSFMGKKNEKIHERLIRLLSVDKRYFTDKGELLKNAVYEDAMKMDSSLIKLLLSDDTCKARFFTEVDGVLVFDKVGFGWVINNRQFLPDSYTRFKNKIGLTDSNGDFISSSNDVVLSFPYKDCVLEGGQSKEDQKREEIFYNETLAPEEVDRLLYPKVFTGAKRYTKDGVEENITFDENDNLIIKGNNLLAIASLLKKYEGKIKCIYIDIPYNTGSDSFGYNDNFNHSTWLTFIKNRLSIAKQLLRNDGCIFIQCDDNEQAYLKVLCDEVLGRENFVNCIAVKMSEATGVKMTHASKKLPKLKEYILLYKKNTLKLEEIRIPKEKWDSEYKLVIDGVSKRDLQKVKSIMSKELVSDDDILTIDNILYNAKFFSVSNFFDNFSSIDAESKEKLLYENAWRIVRDVATTGSAKSLADEKKLTCQGGAFAIKTPQKKCYLIKKEYSDTSSQPRIKLLFADEYLTCNPCDFWQDIKTTGIENEGGVLLTNGKKPEKLISRIIQMSTTVGDLVLDFFGGSGTTAAVAMKMQRQFIVCEQIHSYIDLELVRLNNVLMGDDNTGVSKDVNWQGGGSFVYCELAKLNQTFVEAIQSAENDEQLASVWFEMRESGFISSYVNPKDINAEAEDFNALSFDEKKRLFIALLDKNMLYVNYCDIDDESYAISEEDKAFTHSFYKES